MKSRLVVLVGFLVAVIALYAGDFFSSKAGSRSEVVRCYKLDESERTKDCDTLSAAFEAKYGEPAR
ncbi:hypothetical protein N5D52_27365 [Pseudomonas sp. GD03860]|mgnify:CR=1 FL=1|uniref:hypothetical protein n=1 Tax=Pseudomonas sp. GD03860 TaxID=2975389 RepID=UPI00244CD616|nr:hypothetical protein [Pseudomonas sp. GD03860]MDH0640648.1 hypothetical protein [Pseudomonas sp. GD03860]